MSSAWYGPRAKRFSTATVPRAPDTELQLVCSDWVGRWARPSLRLGGSAAGAGYVVIFRSSVFYLVRATGYPVKDDSTELDPRYSSNVLALAVSWGQIMFGGSCVMLTLFSACPG